MQLSNDGSKLRIKRNGNTGLGLTGINIIIQPIKRNFQNICKDCLNTLSRSFFINLNRRLEDARDVRRKDETVSILVTK